MNETFYLPKIKKTFFSEVFGREVSYIRPLYWAVHRPGIAYDHNGTVVIVSEGKYRIKNPFPGIEYEILLDD